MIQKPSKAIFLFLLILSASCTSDPVRIACIGDSITAGDGLSSESRYSYPVELAIMLGPNYQVFNFGRSAATMLKNGNWPYWTKKEFYNVFAVQPDVVVIHLGTNDTKPVNWDAAKYESDYQDMIDALNTLSEPPEIFLCMPVPVIRDRWGINDSTMQAGVLPVINKIAVDNNLRIIDLNTPMKNHPENFPDGVHPNEEGTKRMAAIVGETILRDF